MIKRRIAALASALGLSIGGLVVVPAIANAAWECTASRVCLYQNTGGTGTKQTYGATTGLFNNNWGVSSVKNIRSYDATLYSGANGAGSSFCLVRGHQSDLSPFPFPGGGTWDDKPNSIRIHNYNCG